jgi:hypothetical protein
MTPIEKIKSGIQQEDMNLVSEGFYDLTGERVSREEVEVQDPLLKQVVAPDAQADTEDFITSTRSSGKPSKYSRAEPLEIRDRENSFVDDGTEATEDRELDKILAVKPPVQRNRRAFKKISIQCSSCNKEFQISPSLARENYKCDSCIMRI